MPHHEHLLVIPSNRRLKRMTKRQLKHACFGALRKVVMRVRFELNDLISERDVEGLNPPSTLDDGDCFHCWLMDLLEKHGVYGLCTTSKENFETLRFETLVDTDRRDMKGVLRLMAFAQDLAYQSKVKSVSVTFLDWKRMDDEADDFDLAAITSEFPVEVGMALLDKVQTVLANRRRGL